MSRPYFSTSIADLERAFEGVQDRAQLQALADELIHRSTDRARTLADRVEDALNIPAKSIARKMPPPSETPVREPEPQATKSIANDPEDILRAWTALEVLSPPSFIRPEQLAGGYHLYTVSPNEWAADIKVLDQVDKPGGQMTTLARFIVDPRNPRPEKE